MTDLESFSARLKSLTDGRASAPRVKDGIMNLVLDVGGCDPRRRPVGAGREGCAHRHDG
jgi:ATP-binding protein involved in chromosome partitioning